VKGAPANAAFAPVKGSQAKILQGGAPPAAEGTTCVGASGSPCSKTMRTSLPWAALCDGGPCGEATSMVDVEVNVNVGGSRRRDDGAQSSSSSDSGDP